MATTTFTYASQANFKDYFPHLVSMSDNKTPVYNFNQLFTHGGFELYEADNTGLVEVLFKDGQDLTPYQKTENYTDSTTNTNEAVDIVETAIDVVDGTVFAYGDIIRIDSEKMLITNISSNTITVERGFLGTTTATHSTATDVYIGVTWTEENQWLYNAGCDALLFYAETIDPNNLAMESGSDYQEFMNNQLYRASMELNNMLDGRFPNPIPKAFMHSDTPSTDTAQYDAIIVKLTCYIAAVNMLRASSDYEQAEIIQNEISNIDNTGMVDKLNAGQFKLAFEIDKTDSSGDIIEVTNTGSMNLVETYGEWTGMRYDRVQLICTTAGAYGTARMTIKTYDGNNLYGAETLGWEVTGGLDHIGNGLYVRFEGNSMAENDRWDIEVRNYTLKQSNSQGTRSIDSIRNDLSQAKIIRRKRIY
jgi:hypothetical protein